MKILAVAVAALVLALVGCAPTPASDSSDTPSASSSPALAKTPVPALPLTCAQLFTIGGVQAHLHDTVSTKIDETHVGPALFDLALLQAGGTECGWGGQNGTDGAYDTGVVIKILPDAATEFAARELPTIGPLVSGTIGSSSLYYCPDGGVDWCTGDALAGNYWVTFQLGDANGAEGSGDATVEAIMNPLVAAIAKAGGTVAAWAQPAKPFDGAALCSASTAPALVSAALGAPATVGDAYELDGLPAAAATRAGMVRCSWSAGDNSSLGVDVLPGGSWVYPRFTAAQPSWFLIGDLSALQVPGADGAIGGCGEHCEYLVDVGKSLVDVDLSDVMDQPTAAAITQKLIAGIAAG